MPVNDNVAIFLRQRVDRFFDLLNRAGIVTITRKTRGDDIDAACGQLVGRVQDRTRVRLGEKLVSVAARPL